MTRGRRDLTPEEMSLWARIARSVRPLAGRAMPHEPAPPGPESGAPATLRPQPAPGRAPARPKAPPPLAPLEPKLARALKRGGAVDARLDLHGLRQDEAHDRLLRFLRTQQARGARVVLVITGKGSGSEKRGVLRRLVPAWLAEPALRDVVLGVSEAGPAHGGAGALYVRLRRARD